MHGELKSDVIGEVWMGWAWSPWIPTIRAIRAARGPDVGLYRVRSNGAAVLLYVGKAGSPIDHASTWPSRRSRAPTGGSVRSPHRSLWAVVQAPIVHLLEHENDLIDSHVLTTGKPPVVQFLG